jgi:hypothetical protein
LFNALVSWSAGGADRLHEPGDNVVDVSGDGDARGDGGRGTQALDVASDRRRGVEDCVLAQGRLFGADPLGVAAAEGVVGQRGGSALAVVDHGDLDSMPAAADPLGLGSSNPDA